MVSVRLLRLNRSRYAQRPIHPMLNAPASTASYLKSHYGKCSVCAFNNFLCMLCTLFHYVHPYACYALFVLCAKCILSTHSVPCADSVLLRSMHYRMLYTFFIHAVLNASFGLCAIFNYTTLRFSLRSYVQWSITLHVVANQNLCVYTITNFICCYYASTQIPMAIKRRPSLYIAQTTYGIALA